MNEPMSKENAQLFVSALKLGNDRRRLRELRAGLREQMRRCPLTDVAGFTRNLEKAYRAMWHRWCADQDRSTRWKCQDVSEKDREAPPE